jgi:hypothetical protein
MARRQTQNPTVVLGEITRMLATEASPVTQAALALRLNRRYGDNTLGLALASGARAGVLAFDADELSWALAGEGTVR